MKQFSVWMALCDFIPVVFFAVAAVLLQRDLYNKMSKGAFALFAGGTIFIIFAGSSKALYKLLYALGICDFEALNTLMFPVQSMGLMLAGIGMIAMLFFRQKEKVLAVAPPVFKGTMIFVVFMIAGLGMMVLSLCRLSKKLKKHWLIPVFILSFIMCLGMRYLSSKDFDKAIMNWIAEGVNILGQGLFLFGTIKLHKAGLAELKLKEE
ncbi:MAG: hypothetical protein IKM87_02665 [Clostridia bacterium]|nr:hypothetical protein [Clostridia bacterium]